MNKWIKVEGGWKLGQLINSQWLSNGKIYSEIEVFKHLKDLLEDTKSITIDYYNHNIGQPMMIRDANCSSELDSLIESI